MELKLAEKIVEVCQNEGIEAELRTEYSGRGMYGRTTAGIVVNSFGELLAAIISNADKFVEYDAGFGWPSVVPKFRVGGFSQDQMGLGLIIY